MKKRKFNFCLLITLFLASCTSSVDHEQTSDKTHLFSGQAMTMEYKIIIGANLNEEEQQTIQKVIQRTFHEINQIYNKWNKNSEISKLNRLKKSTVVTISFELEQLLKESEKIVTLSKGFFDPTIEPIQALWKKSLKSGLKPSESEIQSTMQAVGWDKIHFSNGLFYKDHDETSIDLGAIAKGFTVDSIVLRLNEIGYLNVFVEWGGEIKTSGIHPEGRPWRIFISRLHDKNPDHAVANIDLINESIATSGDYLQNWTVKNENGLTTYFHLVNPKTGYLYEIKKKSIASASVKAKSCMFADALATTLMLFPTIEEATSWIESIQKENDVKFWIITR